MTDLDRLIAVVEAEFTPEWLDPEVRRSGQQGGRKS